MTTIRLERKATIHKASQILKLCQQALLESEEPIQIDWSEVEVIDASVLQILIALRKARKLKFTEASDAVKATLSLAGLSELAQS